MRSFFLFSALLLSGCPFFLDSLQEAGNCNDLVDNDNNNFTDCDDPVCTTDPICIAAALCGNAILDNGEGCDDANKIPGDGCDALCQVEPPPLNCGDGILNADEECDDGNTENNDACSNICRVNGDIFVDCQAQVLGDGSLGAPFQTLQEAILASPDAQLRRIILLSGQCNGNALIQNKQLFIVSRGASLVLAAGDNFIVNASNVLLENISLSGEDENEALAFEEFLDGAINVQANAVVAFIGGSISFADPGDAIVDAQCFTAQNGASLIIDRSTITDCAGGGVEISGASAFITNSLFQNNGSATSAHGALSETIFSPGFLVFGSNFDGNQSSPNAPASSVMGPCQNGMRVEGSIWNNNNSAPSIILGVGCDVNTSIMFGFGAPPATDNLDVDPLFIQDTFHLSIGSPAGNSLLTLPPAPFDPNAPFVGFGVGDLNLFGHDFEGKPRPLNSVLDRGMFEDL
jgi:cysteine-rich repeat protein